MDEATRPQPCDSPDQRSHEFQKSEFNYVKSWQAHAEKCLSEEGLLKAFERYRQAFLRLHP